MEPPKVAAILVTFHPKWPALNRLLGILQRSPVDSIYIIDNTPWALISDIQLRTMEKIIYIPLGENQGIGAAQNLGTRTAIADGHDHIIYFDQDSQPSEGMIHKLLLSSDLLSKNQLENVIVGPARVDPRTGTTAVVTRIGSTVKKILVDYRTDQHPIQCDLLISSGTLVSKQCIELCGKSREDFFIDCIDIEWGFRAKSKGIKLYTIPDAIMFHQVGDDHLTLFGHSLTMHSPLRHYYFYRNFYFMLGLAHVPLAWKIFVFIKSTLQAVIFSLIAPERYKHSKMILKGIFHGLTGKLGKYGQ